jgi:hypothetical protein
MSTVVRVGDDADVTSDKQTSSRQQKDTFIVEEGKFNLNDCFRYFVWKFNLLGKYKYEMIYIFFDFHIKNQSKFETNSE